MGRKLVAKLAAGVRALRPRRRWLRFSLATLLVAVTAVCVWLGIVTERARRQLAFVELVRRGGGTVYYTNQISDDGTPLPEEQWREPPRLVRWFGEGYAEPGLIQFGFGDMLDQDFAILARFGEVSRFHPMLVAIDDERFRHLRGMTRLTELQIYDGAISDEGLVNLADMHELTGLQIGASTIAGPGLVHLADKKRLTLLNLGDSDVSDEGLTHLSRLTALESLSLRGAKITDSGLIHLAALTQLDYLDLSGTEIGDEGLVHLAGLVRLRNLMLDNTKIRGPGLRHLAGLTQLHSLDLAHTPLDGDGIINLPVLPALQQISLTGTQTGDRGAARLATFPALHSALLDGTALSDYGAVALAQSPRLERLAISRCDVGDRGLAALAAKANLLYADDCLIIDAGLDALNGKFTIISLSGSPVTEAGVTRYRERFNIGPRDLFWFPRPRSARRVTPADLARLTEIREDDDADDLWRRGLIVALAQNLSDAFSSRIQQLVRPAAVSQVFRAAVERSDRPAPIFVAWGDLGFAARDVNVARQTIERRLPGHPEASLLRAILDSRNSRLTCYAAAAALEPNWGAPWWRLAYSTRRHGTGLAPNNPDNFARQMAAAFRRHDVSNAVAHYFWAAQNSVSGDFAEFVASLEEGNAAPNFDPYPTPFPPDVRESNDRPQSGGPPVEEPVFPYREARSAFFGGFDEINQTMGVVPRVDDDRERLRSAMSRAIERLRDAAVAAGSASGLAEFNSSIIYSTQSPSGNVDELQAAINTTYASQPPLRLPTFLEDFMAAERARSQEIHEHLKDHGFDGPLEATGY